jgi:hypothetical protein
MNWISGLTLHRPWLATMERTHNDSGPLVKKYLCGYAKNLSRRIELSVGACILSVWLPLRMLSWWPSRAPETERRSVC